MGDVTGPISTLPGALHELPKDAKCDVHQDRAAVVRIQGETDSFGCEMHDCCQECADEIVSYARSPEARTGRCDWCKKDAADLADTRDYDEGMAGPLYRVCGPCRNRLEDEARAELDACGDDGWDDDDEMAEAEMNCGKMSNGQCSQAGTEYCDWSCPFSR